MHFLAPIFWSIVLLPPATVSGHPAPVRSPDQAFHTLHFPGRGDLEITLPAGSTAIVERWGEERVTLDVVADVPRVPITPPGGAPASTRPATTGLGYYLSLTLEPPSAEVNPALERVQRAIAKVELADQKPTPIEIRGRDVAGYYYTYTVTYTAKYPVTSAGKRRSITTTRGCVVTGGMCFSFDLLHGEKDARKLDHALSVVRGIRQAPRPTSAPTSAPTYAP